MAAEDELEVLAGEYVLGSLAADERAAVERQLLEDADLAQRVAAWRESLGPLSLDLAPVKARPELWWRVRRSIAERQRAVPRDPWWRRVGFWRGWAVSTTAAALALLVFALATRAPAPELLAVLDDPEGRPLWVVRASSDASRLVARPLAEGAPPDRVPELWLLREGQVISLGLLDREGTSQRAVAGPAEGALRVGDRLAVSIEPPGGSPTGRATGPVVSRGVLVAEPS
jgi:anti-sigma-K factor RskA